jgi:hypothetical protein
MNLIQATARTRRDLVEDGGTRDFTQDDGLVERSPLDLNHQESILELMLAKKSLPVSPTRCLLNCARVRLRVRYDSQWFH